MKFKIIFSVIVFFIGCIPLIISGREEFMNNLDVKQTLSGVSGFIWAFIPSVLVSNLDEIVKNNFSKLIGIHDPLFGNPIGRKDKIKHYESDDDLPSFAKLVKIEKIKEVNILSISSYVLILRHINHIREKQLSMT